MKLFPPKWDSIAIETFRWATRLGIKAGQQIAVGNLGMVDSFFFPVEFSNVVGLVDKDANSESLCLSKTQINKKQEEG